MGKHRLQHTNSISNTGFYGKGLYLAEKARYSNGTAEKTYAFVEPDGTRSLLLVRAALGRQCVFADAIDRELRMPPRDEDSGLLCDSVQGGPHRPQKSGPGAMDSCIHVVYDVGQVYPEYVVKYRLP